MIRVFCNDEHERLYDWLVVLAGKDFQFYLGVLVNSDAILQLQIFQSSLVVVLDVEIFPCGYCWLFYEPVIHGTGQGIAVDHVLEWLSPSSSLDLRGGCEF